MALQFKTPIDYEKISDAISFYKNRGYSYIEVPWIIGSEAMDVTSPKNKQRFRTFLGELVASAEQSFIELIIKEELKPGKYVTCSPCFRDEVDLPHHYSWFMKVELINFLNNKRPHTKKEHCKDDFQREFRELLTDATDFYSRYVAIKKVRTEEGVDIEFNNIELGSYGIREYKGIYWIYGTGVAEPRFSEALSTKPSGYHEKIFPKGDYGSAEKIFEEIQELKDSLNQQNKVLTLLELSDIIGAIEGYLEKEYGKTMTLDDLLIMKEATGRAFKTGARVE